MAEELFMGARVTDPKMDLFWLAEAVPSFLFSDWAVVTSPMSIRMKTTMHTLLVDRTRFIRSSIRLSFPLALFASSGA